MENSPRFVVLIVLLLFIFVAPDQTAIQRQGRLQDERVKSLRQADFDVIANSTYGELEQKGLNLTGFTLKDDYQWRYLSQIKGLARKQQSWDPNDASTSVYHHLSADVRGKFVRIDSAADPHHRINLTALDPFGGYVTHQYQRNITESEGEISISFDDYSRIGEAQDIKATIRIFTDSSPGTGWDGDLRGIHFLDGSIILTTGSRKFNAIPAIPHFSLNEREFDLSRKVINATVTRLWDHLTFNDGPVLNVPRCELVVWLQQKALRGSKEYTRLIEQELQTPEGAPISKPQPIAFSATVFSPDCGYVLQADTLYGPKAEAYWALVRRLLVAFIGILAFEITLLKRQMEKCATPSTRARISYYSIGIAAFGDGLILLAMIGLLMIENGASLLLGAAAFLCCMHVAFFEVKFIFDIWTVQVGDPAQAQRERERRTATATTNNNTEGLPLPATAPTEATAVPGPATQVIQSSRATFASLYSRFYFALVNLMFFSLWAMSWPQRLRSGYINLLSFCYFSLWIPQIYRNIMRNCRKALNWEYVIGTSVLRAIPILYWYFDDRNVLSAKANPFAALILISWLWLQVTILLSQQYLGPRLLVRDSWCPPAYDYHPVLSDDLESRGMPIGEVASASEGKDKDNKTRRVFDCAICMNEIDVPVISKDESNGRSWLEQRNYMVTPCRHIFHADCLEGWMNLRLVCPVCREGLPPL